MATGFTYDDELQDNASIVRFLLQQHVQATSQLSDGEILWALSTEANIYQAAALCAETLATRVRGVKQKKVGDLSITYSTEEWEHIAKRLRTRGMAHQVPTAGGVDVDDRDSIRQDTTLLHGDMFSNMHRDPRSIPPYRGTSDDEELTEL